MEDQYPRATPLGFASGRKVEYAADQLHAGIARRLAAIRATVEEIRLARQRKR